MGFLWYIFCHIRSWILSIYAKIWLRENHTLCSVKLSLLVNSGTKFFSVVLAKFCAWSAKLAALTSSTTFFLQLKVLVYIFGSERSIYWASILNLLNSNQIPQDWNWCMVPTSDLNNLKRHNMHGVKSVQIRSFFWSVFSRTRTEYGPEKTPYLDTFHAVMI